MMEIKIQHLAQQGSGADALQRPLRFRFRVRLKPGVQHRQ
jgi:hypothetical protein